MEDLVNGAAAIDLRRPPVRIEDLHLVRASEVDAAVSALLTGHAGGVRRRHVLDVQTQVVELHGRLDVRRRVHRDDLHAPITDEAPLRRCAAVRVLPTGQAGAVEEHDLAVRARPVATCSGGAGAAARARPTASARTRLARDARASGKTAAATGAAGSGRADRAAASGASDRGATRAARPGRPACARRAGAARSTGARRAEAARSACAGVGHDRAGSAGRRRRSARSARRAGAAAAGIARAAFSSGVGAPGWHLRVRHACDGQEACGHPTQSTSRVASASVPICRGDLRFV